MARSKEECARLIVKTLKTELGELVQAVMGVSADPKNPEGMRSLERFKDDVLSGKGRASEAFCNCGMSISLPDEWIFKLLKVGITREELHRGGFLTEREFHPCTVVAANGRFEEAIRGRG